MYPYGLPIRLPIAHGMALGNRYPAELEWLLDHGVIQSDLRYFLKISKVTDQHYTLVKQDNELEEEIFRSDSLAGILGHPQVSGVLPYWHWWGNPVTE